MAVSYKYWRVGWSDYNGNNCEVKITDTDASNTGTATYSLSAGVSPFVVSRDSDDDPLIPIRTSSATINLVGNFRVLKKAGESGTGFKLTSSDRYRVVFKVDGVVKWLGWLKAESLTQAYTSNNNEFALNCIDDLQAMGAWNMLQSNKSIGGRLYNGGFGLAEVHSILSECFARTEGVLGTDDAHSFIFAISGEDNIWELKSAVTRQLFFNETELDSEDVESKLYDPYSCYDTLETICRSFGWSCQQIGKDIYFNYAENHRYNSAGSEMAANTQALSFGQLYELPTSVSGVNISDVQASDVSVIGSHSIDMHPGYHRICVHANLSSPGDLLRDLENFASFEFDEGDPVERAKPLSDKEPYYRRGGAYCKGLEYSLNTSAVKLFWWDLAATSVSDYTVTEHDYTGESNWWRTPYLLVPGEMADHNGAVRAALMKQCTYDDSDITRYDFTFGLAITAKFPVWLNSSGGGKTLVGPDREGLKSMPVAQISGGYVMPFDGALTLNMDISNMRGGNTNMSDLQIRVKVGDWFWVSVPSGDGFPGYWTNIGQDAYICPQWDNGTGPANIMSLKTVNSTKIPFNGAEGLVMPLTPDVCGELRLDIFCPKPDVTYNDVRIMINDIKFEYVAKDKSNYTEQKSGHSYIKYVEGWTEKLSAVNVTMHSQRDNEISYGQIFEYDGTNWVALEGVRPQGGSEDERVRPEKMLLDKLASYYGRARKVISLELKRNDNLKPGVVFTAADGSKWAFVCCAQMDWRTGIGVYLFVDIN